MTVKTERIEARFTPSVKKLAERAASVSGLSLTDYLTKLVTENAPKTLQHYETITLTNQRFDDFIAYCDGDCEPSERLKSAMNRLKSEGFNSMGLHSMY